MEATAIQMFIDVWGQTALLWQRLRRSILIKEQITETDKRILYGLYRVKALTKKELAKRVVLEHSSLTRSLDRLEQKRLIARIASKNDKRYIELSLTQAGFSKVESVRMQSLHLAQHLFSGITEESIQQASTVINEFKNAMETMLEIEIEGSDV